MNIFIRLFRQKTLKTAIKYLCLAANVAANEQDKELRITCLKFFMNIFKRLFRQKTAIKYHTYVWRQMWRQMSKIKN
jgi:hypothetical protein